MSFLNTTHSGSVRNVIFQENGEWFAVALEFNIVETGDSPQEVMVLLDTAIKGYVDSARKSVTAPLIGHDYQQIDVRVVVRSAICVRAKQDDLLRMELLGDPVTELANVLEFNHGRAPTAAARMALRFIMAAWVLQAKWRQRRTKRR